MANNSVNDKIFLSKHRTEWHEFLWNNLLEKLTVTKTKQQTGKIINALFSNYEKSVITKRLAALALIRAGVGTREIMRTLWVSPATISALKKNFFGNPSVYTSQRSFQANKKPEPSKILIKKSWLDDIFKDVDFDIWELLTNPPRPTGMGIKNHRLK